jgi:Xaa-Pro dipeptidase
MEEYRGRLERAGAVLRDRGWAAAVCVDPATLFYLSGYDAHTHFSEQALIVFADGDEPVLILREVDVPLVQETSWLRRVSAYHYGRDDPSELVAQALGDRLLGERVGLEMATNALPFAFGSRIATRLGDRGRLEDASRAMGSLRVVKSERELDYVRQAAAISRLTVGAAVGAIRAGANEFEVAAEIDHTLDLNHSEYPAMPTWIASGPRTTSGHASPADRVISEGEPVCFSFATVRRRYHVSVYHTVHTGRPSTHFSEMYAAAREAQEALVGAVRLGAPISHPALAGAAVLKQRGLDRYAKMRWGYGVGIAYPPTWLEPLDIIEEAEGSFQPGMVFCLHVPMSFPDRGYGLILGGDYLLTEGGLEALDSSDFELAVL